MSRYFKHHRAFKDSQTQYVECLDDGRVYFVKRDGDRFLSQYCTLQKCIDRVKSGEWIEVNHFDALEEPQTKHDRRTQRDEGYLTAIRELKTLVDAINFGTCSENEEVRDEATLVLETLRALVRDE